MTPPRPAAITAAAVLLLVFGGESLLLALAALVATAVDAVKWPLASGIGLTAFIAAVGIAFSTAAIRLLRGSLETPARAGEYTTAVGFLAAVFALGAVWLVVMAVDGPARVPLEKQLLITAGASVVVANTAGLFVAGWLLRRQAGRYHRWVQAGRRPPDDTEDPA